MLDSFSAAGLLLDTLALTGDAAEPDNEIARRWHGAPHHDLVALAVSEGVALWLARRLQLFSVRLESGAQKTLAAAATTVRASTMRVDAALERTVALLQDDSIEVVLLKSVALRRCTSRLPMADARASSDVDVLVREQDADRAVDVLGRNGFAFLTPDAAHAMLDRHHRAPMVDRWGVGIELHVTTDPRLARSEAWARANDAATDLPFSARMVRVPNDFELLSNAVAHAHKHAYVVEEPDLRLKYWLDGAVLMRGGTIDSARVLSRLRTDDLAPHGFAVSWLRWALRLAGLPSSIPHDDGRGGHFDLQRLLGWRLLIRGIAERSPRWHARLTQEAKRHELDLPRLASPPDASAIGRVRRGAATLAARARYASWYALLPETVMTGASVDPVERDSGVRLPDVPA